MLICPLNPKFGYRYAKDFYSVGIRFWIKQEAPVLKFKSRWMCFCSCGKANNQRGVKWRVWLISIATTVKNTFTILNHESVVAREIINCKIYCSVWLEWFKGLFPMNVCILCECERRESFKKKSRKWILHVQKRQRHEARKLIFVDNTCFVSFCCQPLCATLMV